MSLLIDCPHCGPRPMEEWVHGEILNPPDSLTDPEARNLDRAFFHTNAEGPVVEAWFHLYGCRRWVRVRRDTATDRLL